MSAAIFWPGWADGGELGYEDVIDRFIRSVIATSDMIEAAANSGIDEFGGKSLSQIAFNLSLEAQYAKEAWDQKRMEGVSRLEKQHPKLVQVEQEEERHE